MKPDFEAKYRTMMKNMIDKGESFDSIKSSLFVLRDDLLDNAARKLRAEVDGDVAYIFSTTFFNAIFPSSGLLITPAYTLSICEDISSAMGIAVSGTTAAKDVTVASAESAFIEFIIKEGFGIVGQEVATTLLLPIPCAALLVMPYKWKKHREHKFHMIHFTHQKAEKYHTDWIVDEMNRFAIRDTNRLTLCTPCSKSIVPPRMDSSPSSVASANQSLQRLNIRETNPRTHLKLVVFLAIMVVMGEFLAVVKRCGS
ncbi:hypothetical protein ACHAXH_005668 [Discostella pseudostelligera]